MEKIIARDNWPIHSDITNPLHAFMAGSDTCGHQKSMDRKLEVGLVINFSLMDNPTIRQPGFDLP